jgi:hypothetical protein
MEATTHFLKLMTALALSAIPSNINSYERLLVWCAQAMSSAANGKTINVFNGEAQQPQVSVSFSTLADDQTYYVATAYVRANLADIANPDQKPWMAAQDVVSASPHVNFVGN